jgi:phosphoribosylformylglycinamidine synthase
VGAFDVAVLQFPGSNCDQDVVSTCARLGLRVRLVWHREAELGAVRLVLVPGGFSYGDYLRSGAIAAHSPVMMATRRFAEAGGAVLGICNGFQILCEAGLLPGALTRNDSLRFECRYVHVRVEGQRTPCTAQVPAAQILELPIAHADGRYHHDNPAELEANGQVIFRYCDAAGGLGGTGVNPNGSVASIAGVSNGPGNVVGLMPHPERAVDSLLGTASGGARHDDGRQLFDSLVASLADRTR